MICDEDTVASFCVRVTFEQWNHFNGKLWAWSIKKRPCKMVFGIYCMLDLANSYQLRQESNSLLAPPHLPVPKCKGWKNESGVLGSARKQRLGDLHANGVKISLPGFANLRLKLTVIWEATGANQARPVSGQLRQNFRASFVKTRVKRSPAGFNS